MSNQDNNVERIGTVNVKNIGLVNVYYIGGSTFEMRFPSGAKTKPVRFRKNVADKLVSDGSLKLISDKRYDDITKSILSDGSTRTHNADGSAKSVSAQVLDELYNDGYAKKDQNGRYESIDRREAHERPDEVRARSRRSNAPSPGDTDSNNSKDNHGDDRLSSTPHYDDNDANRKAFGDLLLASDSNDGPRRRDNGKQQRRSYDDGESSRGRYDAPYDEHHSIDETYDEQYARGDINGDGVVDIFDELVEKEQHGNMFLIGILLASAIVSIALFFFFQGVTAHFIRGESLDFVPDNIEQQAGDNGAGSNSASNSPGATHGDNDADDEFQQNGSDANTVKRSDFDPESSVRGYQVADDAQFGTASTMFQLIRSYISNGDVASFKQAVDIDAIASEIATSYANASSAQHQMTESEKADLQQQYASTLSNCERQHVADKDPYGSMFGGRIRDVRIDPSDQRKLYVVMESIAGDHQRACFVMTESGENAWTIDGMLDSDGYVKMIMEGDSSQFQS